MPDIQRFEGSCHCGNIQLSFKTRTRPGEVRVRECACHFCRKHGTRSIADPAAKVGIRIADPEAVTRYRFGLKTADFLVCRECGVYAAAVLETEDGQFATVNLNVLDDERAFTRKPLTISYEGESAEQRLARRRRKWSPVSEFALANSRRKEEG